MCGGGEALCKGVGRGAGGGMAREMKRPPRVAEWACFRLPPVSAAAAGSEGKGIELRHQRNPDVTFDCLVAAAAGGGSSGGDSSGALSERVTAMAGWVFLHPRPSAHFVSCSCSHFTTPCPPYLPVCRRPAAAGAAAGAGGPPRGDVCGHRDAAAHRQGRLLGAVGAAGGAAPRVDARRRGGLSGHWRRHRRCDSVGSSSSIVGVKIQFVQ